MNFKYIYRVMSSPAIMGVLFVLGAIAMGRATFIENDYGREAAYSVVYDTWWFETMFVICFFNMLCVILQRKLYRRKKLSAFFLHFSLMVIILGAGVTRYFGVEGIMHIREGEEARSFRSTETYIRAKVSSARGTEVRDQMVRLTMLNTDKYTESFSLPKGDIQIRLKQHIPNASEQMVSDEDRGRPIIAVVTGGANGRITNYIQTGHHQTLSNGLHVSFDVDDADAKVNMSWRDESPTFVGEFPVYAMSMATQRVDTLVAGMRHVLSKGYLYTVATGESFVVQGYMKRGVIRYVQADEYDPAQPLISALVMEVSVGDESKDLLITGGKGYVGMPQELMVSEDVKLSLSYGSVERKLPFGVELVDFELQRYPGSESPSSYASEVNVVEGDSKVPFRIYMNNILSHGGYRFYQSSYDQDELGTVLSVNQDVWGSGISYLGYGLLLLGFVVAMVSGSGRYMQLGRMIRKLQGRTMLLVICMVGGVFWTDVVQGQMHEHEMLKAEGVVSQEHAERFGALLYQTPQGRVETVNTLTSSLLRKVTRGNTFDGLSANQVLLHMMLFLPEWQTKRMIKVENKELQSRLEIDGEYAMYIDFFDAQGNYKLSMEVEQVFSKKPGSRGVYDKNLMKVDERVNICYAIYKGLLLTVFPVPGQPASSWLTPVSSMHGIDTVYTSFMSQVMHNYFVAVREAMTNGDYSVADSLLTHVDSYQRVHGKDIIPSDTLRMWETIYIEWNVFQKLFPFFLFVGLLLLVLEFVRLLSPRVLLPRFLSGAFFYLLVLGFAFQTFFLGVRWYISGHAPWSNGYESMIYIAWATMLAGILYRKSSSFTLATTAILSGITLLVAHLSWMDPELTNLVPVLKSYWLTIHVSAITASYGFLALTSLLSCMVLLIMCAKREVNHQRLDVSIKKLTYIAEMAMIVGLALLTVGNFLGGIWANESWGRYWGWDPKETWALITIIVYAFVLHLRFIPGMRSIFLFNFFSLIAYASVLMTYFGVNFYLSGLHSYAKGDPVPMPVGVYYAVVIVLVLSLVAYLRNRKYDIQRRDEEV